jgi:hypothetical protein
MINTSNANPNTGFCRCKNGLGFMIGCDGGRSCSNNGWCHPACIGLDMISVESLSPEWLCPDCSISKLQHDNDDKKKSYYFNYHEDYYHIDRSCLIMLRPYKFKFGTPHEDKNTPCPHCLSDLSQRPLSKRYKRRAVLVKNLRLAFNRRLSASTKTILPETTILYLGKNDPHYHRVYGCKKRIGQEYSLTIIEVLKLSPIIYPCFKCAYEIHRNEIIDMDGIQNAKNLLKYALRKK